MNKFLINLKEVFTLSFNFGSKTKEVHKVEKIKFLLYPTLYIHKNPLGRSKVLIVSADGSNKLSPSTTTVPKNMQVHFYTPEDTALINPSIHGLITKRKALEIEKSGEKVSNYELSSYKKENVANEFDLVKKESEKYTDKLMSIKEKITQALNLRTDVNESEDVMSCDDAEVFFINKRKMESLQVDVMTIGDDKHFRTMTFEKVLREAKKRGTHKYKHAFAGKPSSQKMKSTNELGKKKKLLS